MQDLSPGFFNELLHEESHNFLAWACLRLYRGENTSHPDVMLKVEDDKLPAHRALLAESSDVFKAMFQARPFHLSYAFINLYLARNAIDTALCRCVFAVRIIF